MIDTLTREVRHALLRVPLMVTNRTRNEASNFATLCVTVGDITETEMYRIDFIEKNVMSWARSSIQNSH